MDHFLSSTIPSAETFPSIQTDSSGYESPIKVYLINSPSSAEDEKHSAVDSVPSGYMNFNERGTAKPSHGMRVENVKVAYPRRLYRKSTSSMGPEEAQAVARPSARAARRGKRDPHRPSDQPRPSSAPSKTLRRPSKVLYPTPTGSSQRQSEDDCVDSAGEDSDDHLGTCEFSAKNLETEQDKHSVAKFNLDTASTGNSNSDKIMTNRTYPGNSRKLPLVDCPSTGIGSIHSHEKEPKHPSRSCAAAAALTRTCIQQHSVNELDYSAAPSTQWRGPHSSTLQVIESQDNIYQMIWEEHGDNHNVAPGGTVVQIYSPPEMVDRACKSFKRGLRQGVAPQLGASPAGTLQGHPTPVLGALQEDGINYDAAGTSQNDNSNPLNQTKLLVFDALSRNRSMTEQVQNFGHRSDEPRAKFKIKRRLPVKRILSNLLPDQTHFTGHRDSLILAHSRIFHDGQSEVHHAISGDSSETLPSDRKNSSAVEQLKRVASRNVRLEKVKPKHEPTN